MRIFVFILLALFTSLSVIYFERYQDVGAEIFLNQDFKDGLNHWQVNGHQDQVAINPAGAVSLSSTDAGGMVQISQNFSNEQQIFNVLRLSGSLRVEDVQRGEKIWNLARLLFVADDGSGKWLAGSGQVIALAGTTDWQTYAKVFHVSPEARVVRAILQLSRCTGVFWARDLSLHRVQEAAWYPWLKRTVLGGWGGFLLWTLVSALNRGRVGRLGGVLLFGSLLLIVVGTAIPANLKHDLQEGLAGNSAGADSVLVYLNNIMQENRALYFSWLSPSRISHFSLFLLFGCFVFTFSKAPNRRILLDILMLAVATEMIQFYVEGRTPQFGDGVADFTGGMVAFLFVQGRLTNSRKQSLAKTNIA